MQSMSSLSAMFLLAGAPKQKEEEELPEAAKYHRKAQNLQYVDGIRHSLSICTPALVFGIMHSTLRNLALEKCDVCLSANKDIKV